ncbi:MAG TPA: DNA primase [Stellaceae bacterium]|nr:DNA primase [Stellaceae bacterium]
MAFPPPFLDELRQRISLADVVGRRVKLIRRGREFTGLCPFHKEKTPSFAVVEEKGFYHCFGCGVHGDVIGFTMQTENLTFPEAVEALARQAGMQVPKATPEERKRAERVATLGGACEAACAFFEASLKASEGRAARDYLANRGLDDAAIRRFRLGFAPDGRDALKRALAKNFPEALLFEAGLVRRPEGGGEAFDYFRNRIIFPIGDRGGRIIAFGGRVMGDGQPKYLNSPETPLFAKGRVLYGWAAARAAAAREPSVIVAEGYMDVIALHRAGFGTAVAPLGTALTETQIEELWRLAPEPILCFDGDAAGQRAAARALDRTLPLLKPGMSLRFATLPAGEDPDTLIERQGADAMRAVLERAEPLVERLWRLEAAQPVDTPERRAALEKRLEDRVRQIAERSVQEHYRNFFRDRIFTAFGGRRGPVGGRLSGKRAGWRSAPPPRRLGRAGRPFLGSAEYLGYDPKASGDPSLLRRRQQEILLALLLHHPFLLSEVEEELANLELPARDLDRLCREILKLHGLHPDLDAASLKRHLNQSGFARTIEGLTSPAVLNHAGFARAEASAEAVREGWVHTMGRIQELRLAVQISEVDREGVQDPGEEKWTRLHPLLEAKVRDDDTAEGSG